MSEKPRKRKNSRQLRLSRQNEVITERLLLQFQLEKATTCDWQWFGNYLIQLGSAELKKRLLSQYDRNPKPIKGVK
jgi:hypothetical protein